MKNRIWIIGLAALSMLACKQEEVLPNNNGENEITSLPYEELSEVEIGHLLHLREEEKLARDVYKKLYD